MRNKRTAGLLISVICLAALLSGCGSSGPMIAVSVVDRNITTQAEFSAGSTVQEILQEAELTLGSQDEVEPALDTQVTEDGANITIRRYAKVKVIDEDTETEVEMLGGNASDALQEAKITLGADDSIDCSPEAYLQDGMTIVVTRVRTISLTVNGEEKQVKTSARTVKQLFEEENIKVGKEDRLNVKESDPIADGAKIVLDYVSTKEEKVEQAIAYGTETQYSDSMNKGQSKVSRSGVNGKKELTYKVTYVNGKEESRELIGEKIIQNPVNQIVVYGTKEVAPARTIVSRQKVYDCDGSGHGYEIITYSDGTESYVDF